MTKALKFVPGPILDEMLKKAIRAYRESTSYYTPKKEKEKYIKKIEKLQREVKRRQKHERACRVMCYE